MGVFEIYSLFAFSVGSVVLPCIQVAAQVTLITRFYKSLMQVRSIMCLHRSEAASGMHGDLQIAKPRPWMPALQGQHKVAPCANA